MDNNESDSCDKTITTESSVTDLLSGFGSTNGYVKEFSSPSEGKFNFHSNPWTITLSNLSLSLMNGGMKTSLQDVRYSAFDEYSVHNPNQSGKWVMPPPVPSYLNMHSVKQNEVIKPKDGNCKIFGVPLAGNRNVSDVNQGLQSQQYLPFDSDIISDQSKCLKVVDNLPACKEQAKEYQNFQPFVRDSQMKVQSVSTRSCTKVHKQGIALGRSVDLTKFTNYDELISELDELFDFNGELKRHKKNWLVVYTDDEGDMMLVGDDPWQEFSGVVKKISIYTREEVQRMNLGTLNSRDDDNSSVVAEGMDEKDSRRSESA